MGNKEITKGLLSGKHLIIEADFLEHLLNCLANQKYMPIDNLSKAEKEKQEIIDKAWQKGMDIVINSINKNEEIEYE